MSETALEYRPYQSDSDRDRCTQIISHAFGTSPESCNQWLGRTGELFRVLTRDGTVVATALLYDCGQHFGGRSVPMQGVAAVTVAAEARGQGAAREIMRRCVLEMHALGTAISTLYAATQKLYQSVGYEQAGHLFEYRVPTDAFPGGDAALDVQLMHDRDRAEVRALYRSQVMHLSGSLDRDDHLWDRVFHPRGHDADGYTLRGSDGRIEGYAVLAPRHLCGDDCTQFLTDLQFSTPKAARRLLRFLRDHSSTVRTIRFRGGPHHPLMLLLPEQRFEVTRQDYWMTRIVDVPKALEARGYAPGLSATIEFDLSDELIPSNAGRWSLVVEDGRPTVSKGGSGAVRIDIRFLAALYTGFMHPAQLRALGYLDCSDEHLRTLASLFAGTAPAMSDMF